MTMGENQKTQRTVSSGKNLTEFLNVVK